MDYIKNIEENEDLQIQTLQDLVSINSVLSSPCLLYTSSGNKVTIQIALIIQLFPRKKEALSSFPIL